MTPRTKHMIAGGALGGLAVLLGGAVFHSRSAFALPRPEHQKQHGEHGGHEKHDEENDRGEYGHKKHKHGGH